MSSSEDPLAKDPLAEALYLLSVSFLAIAAYNAIELLFWIFNFFKRRRGLYFWSILTATLSLAGFMISTTLSYFKIGPFLLTGLATAFLYPCLLTAQLLVLYSRLHLISQSRHILRFVFWLIIITSILIFVPFITLLAGFSAGNMRFARPFSFIERFAILAAIARELLVCAIYICEAFRQLRPIMLVKGRAASVVFVHLILVTGAVVVLDAFMIVTVCKGESGMAMTFSCVAHSIKLKLEFAVLNRLVELVLAPVVVCASEAGSGSGSGSGRDSGQSEGGSRSEMVSSNSES
ncbi:hypothetical protein BJY04DRAFT_107754 [Aspergillus karnatakaensis]|uniref:uncharacterized protein n=1 Tax=Aspergillus karnatakaensis TaxID=1810916 RepID=UPI003CCDF374